LNKKGIRKVEGVELNLEGGIQVKREFLPEIEKTKERHSTQRTICMVTESSRRNGDK
jgi:hypothetical protein